MLTSYTVHRIRGEAIGEALVRIMNNDAKRHHPWKVVAVVPRILAFLAAEPTRYEVTDVDVIVETL